MKMEVTDKRKEFKNRIGQANHFLITTLVGLNAIETGLVVQKPSEFATSWNPKDSFSSARRSRDFVLKSVLGWCVESLEMYLTLANRKPKLFEIENSDLVVAYSKAGQSVFKKATLVGDTLKIDPILIGLVECLITWRNYVFHFDIDNRIRDESLSILQLNRTEIQTNFRGLDIELMKDKWETGKDFSFKEAASLINATQQYVECLDKAFLETLDLERYLSESLEELLRRSDRSRSKFLSLPEPRKTSFVHNLIQNKIGIEIEVDDLPSIVARVDRKKLFVIELNSEI